MGPFMGLSFFMGDTGNAIYQDALYRIKKADEKEWIRSVINGNKVANTPVEAKIECPKEYEAYYEATIERRRKRLEKQLAFLQQRYSGLRDSIILVSNAGNEPQPGLEKAYNDYLIATAEAESKLNGIDYLMKDFQITAAIVETKSKSAMEGTQNAESSDT